MADLVGSFIQAEVNRRSQERAFEQQRQLQSDAQAYNTLMFNMSNEYNSPIQQMSRFKAAGLNPNLIYGQMANTSSPIGMSSPSSPSPASIQAPSMLESAQIGLINAQKENIKADTDSKRSDIDLNEAYIDQIGHQNNWTDQQIEESKSHVRKINQEIANLRASEDEIRQNINNLMAQENLTYQQAIAQWIDNIWADERNQATIDHLKSSMRLNNAQAKEIMTLMAAKLYGLQSDNAYVNAMTKRLYQLLPQEVVEAMNTNELYRLQKPSIEVEKNLAEHPGWYYGLRYGTQILGAATSLLTPAAIMYSGKSLKGSGIRFEPKYPQRRSYFHRNKTYSVPPTN